MSVEQLEAQLEERKHEMTFEEQLELRDRILEAKKNAGSPILGNPAISTQSEDP